MTDTDLAEQKDHSADIKDAIDAYRVNPVGRYLMDIVDIAHRGDDAANAVLQALKEMGDNHAAWAVRVIADKIPTVEQKACEILGGMGHEIALGHLKDLGKHSGFVLPVLVKLRHDFTGAADQATPQKIDGMIVDVLKVQAKPEKLAGFLAAPNGEDLRSALAQAASFVSGMSDLGKLVAAADELNTANKQYGLMFNQR